mmetsp:Transcript_1773/g.5161  ORF Transcript_1773/g.5161 Transcript_1773/m.5161 type:complete len:157 (+) Transcript_1773:1370-1840(+)
MPATYPSKVLLRVAMLSASLTTFCCCLVLFVALKIMLSSSDERQAGGIVAVVPRPPALKIKGRIQYWLHPRLGRIFEEPLRFLSSKRNQQLPPEGFCLGSLGSRPGEMEHEGGKPASGTFSSQGMSPSTYEPVRARSTQILCSVVCGSTPPHASRN